MFIEFALLSYITVRKFLMKGTIGIKVEAEPPWHYSEKFQEVPVPEKKIDLEKMQSEGEACIFKIKIIAEHGFSCACILI